LTVGTETIGRRVQIAGRSDAAENHRAFEHAGLLCMRTGPHLRDLAAGDFQTYQPFETSRPGYRTAKRSMGILLVEPRTAARRRKWTRESAGLLRRAAKIETTGLAGYVQRGWIMKRKLIAECIATYVLIFAGTGAIVVNELTQSLTHMGIAITSGLVVMALIYTFGHISGAHMNPAVTIAFLVHGDVTRREAIAYIMTQATASVAASFTLRCLFGNVAHLGATVPKNGWGQSFLLEFLLTFVLVMVIFGSAVHGKAVKQFAGLSIGGTVCLMALFAGPISGASLNPVRSLGPALVSGTFDHLWIYLAATVLGAVAAALVYQYLHE